MKCKRCRGKAVISGYCKIHFPPYFEKTVKETIKKYNLLSKKDKIAVAVSGGKDSITILYILKKFGYNVEGLAVDEGIGGYREKTLKDLKNFCDIHKIKFKIKSFKSEFGKTLDETLKRIKENPCHVCGILRRFLLNKNSKDYEVIVTGHNLDDESQAVLMNILKAQPEISARIGPITGLKESRKFTKRVKPLYFLKDKEVKAYTVLRDFNVSFTECPYSFNSFRAKIQDELNEMEVKKNGSKFNLIKSFLVDLPRLKKKFKTAESVNNCKKCGEPSSGKICKTCALVKQVSI